MLKNTIRCNSHLKKYSMLLQALVLITLTACGGSEQGSDAPLDPNIPITVDNYTPAASADNVGISSNIQVTFSESIELAGMQATINVENAQGSVAGSSITSADRLTFIPSENLDSSSKYTLTIGSKETSAREITETSSVFTTAAAPLEPIIPITVTSHTPAANATAVQINSSIDVLFSESIELSGMQVTIDVATAEGPVAGSSVISADKLTFTPSKNLDYASEYTVTISSATTSARVITAASWGFSTDSAPLEPIVPITVTSHTPAANATAVQINSSIDVLFSESIELSGMQVTIDVATAEGPVAGSSVISADKLTFTPSKNLDYASEYTVTISSATTSARVITAASWGFSTDSAPLEPIVPITVTSHTPAANATAVQINSSIDVLFSESIELSGMQVTIDVATAEGPVAGSSVISADKLTFTPSENLDYASEYTVTISSATTSARVITTASWGFSTDSAPLEPIVPITVTSHTPAANATAVQINSSIDVLFSESIELSGMQVTIDVATAEGPVAGSSVISADKLTFTPSENLDYASEYTVTISSATTSARVITAASWGFSTDSAPLEPIVPITVTSHTPAANATAVHINSSIDVLFSESIELSGMQVTIDVATAQGPVAGSSVISADKLIFTPSEDLDYASEYTFTIGSKETSAREITETSAVFTTVAAPIDPAPSDPEQFTLTSIESSGNTLVTMGIPFAPGMLANTDMLRVFDESGQELDIFVKPTLQWHFKDAPENTLRAVKVQFYADMNSGEEQTYSWDINEERNTTQDLSEKSLSESLTASTASGKAGVDIPKIIAIHKPQYLADSELIEPFKPEANDNHKTYATAQFSWAKNLNFDSSSQADWLFDRPTALYKMCMRTGQSACYVEAIQSYHYWKSNLITQGQASYPDCAGGLTINGSSKACDVKYLYIEPVKLHTALTGIDSLFSDRVFLKKMADLADETYYQGNHSDDYYADDSFTERGAGIGLLAKVSAYELLPEHAASILANINQRIEVLHDMQQTPPDSFSVDGTFRHSWARHEFTSYPGVVANDRRFSPWMSENIVDALWHQYQIAPSDKIKNMLLGMARGAMQWGFNASSGYIDKFGNSLSDLPNGKIWNSSCSVETNGYKPIVLYSGSSTADDQALISTQNSNGQSSDAHNAETVLVLTMGYHFSNDAAEKAEFNNLIQDISNSYFTQSCGSNGTTKRKFNWNNRSNAWGTYLFLKTSS